MKKKLPAIIFVSAVLLLAFLFYNWVYGQGVNFGAVLTEENAAMGYANSLQSLRDARGIESYREDLIGKLNHSLDSLSFAARDVSIYPPTARVLLSISSPKRKSFFIDIRKQRDMNKWHSRDPEQEKRIQTIIDRYAQFGNPYGI